MHLIAVRSDLEPAGIRTHASAIVRKRRLRSDRAANSAILTCLWLVLLILLNSVPIRYQFSTVTEIVNITYISLDFAGLVCVCCFALDMHAAVSADCSYGC